MFCPQSLPPLVNPREEPRVLGVEKERGSIEVGKLADLAVLSQDILAVDPDAIVKTKALMTVVGGKIVHRSGL